MTITVTKNCPKVAEKVATGVYLKSVVFPNRLQNHHTFGPLLKSICHQDIEKIWSHWSKSVGSNNNMYSISAALNQPYYLNCYQTNGFEDSKYVISIRYLQHENLSPVNLKRLLDYLICTFINIFIGYMLSQQCQYN